MAPPTLYDNPISPPCRLVRLVAGVIGVDLKVVNVKDAGIDMKSPEMLKKNPQHTVPTLEDNGLCLAESRAISMYLISKYAKDDSLYPKDVNKRVLVDQRLFYDQDLYNRILSVFLPKFFGKQTDPSSIEKVNEGLETLNRMLDGKQWLAGDNITLADYAIANTLSALEKNPQHTVPTLEDNGVYLAESRAIAMYLISKYAKDDSLYPKDVNKRVLVDQRLFYDQDLYNKILNVFLPKFFGKQTDPSSIEKVNEGLETLNRMLDGKQWLAGDNVTLADYAVAISLSSLDFVPESGIDPKKQPNINQWLPRVENSHPKYGEHLKEFHEALKKLTQK